jgi:hypothetical protein
LSHEPDSIRYTEPEVQQLHEQVIQEHLEPRDGFEPVPIWLLLIFGGLLMWGGYYIGVNSGAFSASIQDRSNPPQVVPRQTPRGPAITPPTPPAPSP